MSEPNEPAAPQWNAPVEPAQTPPVAAPQYGQQYGQSPYGQLPQTGYPSDHMQGKPLSFSEATRKCLNKYADFKGRARRSEYWYFVLSAVIAEVVALGVRAAVSSVGAVLLFLVVVGLILPLIAAAVRRLHDLDKSGAWYFIAFVPFIGGIWLLVLLSMAGTPGPNKYGPPV